jgi:nucleoside-diphosphate-sugar epimerase
MALKVLFIGGTGQISLTAVGEAVAAGHEVSIFNRGQTAEEVPKGVAVIHGDMADDAAYRRLADGKFDVICQFLVFTPAEMRRDITHFAGKTGQYIFISSASAYQKPVRHYLITEKTPLENPYWEYSRNKASCEKLLREQAGLPFTTVRPSHTVRTRLPTSIGGPEVVGSRMLRGLPVIVAGDGMALWTLTRARDFSVPFVRLFGKKAAIGDDFHITADRGHNWDAIYAAIAAGLGVKAEIVHVPSDTLIRYRPDWEGGLLGDKAWSVLFDNSKVKRVAGAFTCAEDLETILEEPIAHFKANVRAIGPQPQELDPLFDRIAAEQSALGR